MSTLAQMRALEVQILSLISGQDIFDLPQAESKLIARLRAELTDVRLDIRDYELSENRREQLAKAKDAKARLDQVSKDILAASEYNVFSAVDVAHITARLEQINDHLE